MLGALGGMVRWGGMAFEPGVTGLFALQCLHGLSFGATHLGMIFFVHAMIDRRYAATAQGIYAAFSGGVVMTAAVAMSGPLYASHQGQAYGYMAAMSGAALALALCLALISPKARVEADASCSPKR